MKHCAISILSTFAGLKIFRLTTARLIVSSLAIANLAIFITVGLLGCGYHFQGTAHTLARLGVERVYVKVLTNNSLRPGVEVDFTSALLKEFSRGSRIRLVSDLKEADAYVEGIIEEVNGAIGPTTTVSQISQDPAAQALNDMIIATEYVASAAVLVKLVRKKDGNIVWQQRFAANKIYPGNNRFGKEGVTSTLINDSQQTFALNEIAKTIASDAYDTMLEVF